MLYRSDAEYECTQCRLQMRIKTTGYDHASFRQLIPFNTLIMHRVLAIPL